MADVEIGEFTQFTQDCLVAPLSGQTVQETCAKLGKSVLFALPETARGLSAKSAMYQKNLAIKLSRACELAHSVSQINPETTSVIVSVTGAVAVICKNNDVLTLQQQLTELDGGNASILVPARPAQIS